MSDKWYTAERREDNRILVHMPGVGYHLEPDDARKLRDSLNVALDESGEDALQILQTEEEVYQVCGKCGRKTRARREFNDFCGMSQPDGGKCVGWFRYEKGAK